MEKRHEIYKAALKQLLYQKENEPWCFFGLCFLISKASNVPIGLVRLEEYPELFAKKPKNTFSEERWFPWSDPEPRIAILKQCIKETKEQCVPKTN